MVLLAPFVGPARLGIQDAGDRFPRRRAALGGARPVPLRRARRIEPGASLADQSSDLRPRSLRAQSRASDRGARSFRRLALGFVAAGRPESAAAPRRFRPYRPDAHPDALYRSRGRSHRLQTHRRGSGLAHALGAFPARAGARHELLQEATVFASRPSPPSRPFSTPPCLACGRPSRPWTRHWWRKRGCGASCRSQLRRGAKAAQPFRMRSAASCSLGGAAAMTSPPSSGRSPLNVVMTPPRLLHQGGQRDDVVGLQAGSTQMSTWQRRAWRRHSNRRRIASAAPDPKGLERAFNGSLNSSGADENSVALSRPPTSRTCNVPLAERPVAPRALRCPPRSARPYRAGS